MNEILQVVMTEPGISGEEIIKRFPHKKKQTVSAYIQRLRMQGRVENRGNSSRGSSWFSTEQLADRIEYIDVARDILGKLERYPTGLQAGYLAMRIEELATGRPTIENSADLADRLEEMAARLRTYHNEG